VATNAEPQVQNKETPRRVAHLAAAFMFSAARSIQAEGDALPETS